MFVRSMSRPVATIVKTSLTCSDRLSGRDRHLGRGLYVLCRDLLKHLSTFYTFSKKYVYCCVCTVCDQIDKVPTHSLQVIAILLIQLTLYIC